MNKVNPREQAGHLVFEYELGAPPDMVWQAISVLSLSIDGGPSGNWPVPSLSLPLPVRKPATGCATTNLPFSRVS